MRVLIGVCAQEGEEMREAEKMGGEVKGRRGCGGEVIMKAGAQDRNGETVRQERRRRSDVGMKTAVLPILVQSV